MIFSDERPNIYTTLKTKSQSKKERKAKSKETKETAREKEKLS
jgi:hypothetical protein